MAFQETSGSPQLSSALKSSRQGPQGGTSSPRSKRPRSPTSTSSRASSSVYGLPWFHLLRDAGHSSVRDSSSLQPWGLGSPFLLRNVGPSYAPRGQVLQHGSCHVSSLFSRPHFDLFASLAFRTSTCAREGYTCKLGGQTRYLPLGQHGPVCFLIAVLAEPSVVPAPPRDAGHPSSPVPSIVQVVSSALGQPGIGSSIPFSCRLGVRSVSPPSRGIVREFYTGHLGAQTVLVYQNLCSVWSDSDGGAHRYPTTAVEQASSFLFLSTRSYPSAPL